ncbi:uncharacterized [Lates japonicus]
MAVIPGAAAAPDQAPLYQQRSRRMGKKSKTQASKTSEFLRGDQAVGAGISLVSSAVMVLLCALPSQASSTGGLLEWEGPE